MSESRKAERSKPAAAIIAAHPDDEVLGCGATAARLAREGWSVHVLLLADGETARATGADPERMAEQIESRANAARAAAAILGCASVELLSFADNRMDGTQLLEIVQPVERFIALHEPSLVLTHHRGDLNIDHRIVHDAVSVACRPQPGHCVRELLFFEVPSSTEWRPGAGPDPFRPDWFVDVEETLEKKIEALMSYRSELRDFPHPRSTIAVRALAQWRGASAGFAAAEAFMLGRKRVPRT